MKLRQLFNTRQNESVASAAIGGAIGREVGKEAGKEAGKVAGKVAGKEAGTMSKTVSRAKTIAGADTLSKEKEKNSTSIGVCFGRWNPPHKGHRAAWEIAARNDTFYVGTNKNTEGPNDPLPYDVKLSCMETIWPEIKGHVVPEQSLFTLASKVYAKHGEDVHLKVATDEDWLTSSLVKYNGVAGAHGFYKFASIEQVPTPRLSSATQLRAAVRAGDRDAFAEAAGVDANTPIRVGAKAVPFFDLVAHYLAKHPEKVKKVKKVDEVTPVQPASVPVPALPADQRPYQGSWAKVVPNKDIGFDVVDFDGNVSLKGAKLADANAEAKIVDKEIGKVAIELGSSIRVDEHKKGVRAMKYTKKPVNPSAQHQKAKEKFQPIKPGVEKQTDECAGVGTITKQNSTADVNKGTPYKNLKAFNLVKEGRANTKAVRTGLSKREKKADPTMDAKKQSEQDAAWERLQAHMNKPENMDVLKRLATKEGIFDSKPKVDFKSRAKELFAKGLTEQQVLQQLIKEGCPPNQAAVFVQGAQLEESSLDTYMAERAAYLAETGMKKIDKAAKGAMKNASTLPALNQSTGSAYMNYRMSIALAGAPDYPTKMEADNWIGGDPLLSTYTEEEFEMIKKAAQQVGAGTIQNWSGKRSQEMADVNKTSAVAKIKRNKYGV